MPGLFAWVSIRPYGDMTVTYSPPAGGAPFIPMSKVRGLQARKGKEVAYAGCIR